MNLLIDTNNLKSFIESLKINEEQKKVLLDELPKMDEKERLELLDMLKNVYLLNEEENKAQENLKNNWQEPEQPN